MKKASAKSEKNGIELVEEATHFLRSASASTLAAYYVGSIPFVTGFIYFGADMSLSPFASQHVAESALAVTALFFWMKFCQAVFAQRVLAQVAKRSMPSRTFRQYLRIFLSQAIVQSTGLFVMPLAAVFVLPFSWVYAFYQSVTASDDVPPGEAGSLVKRAWKQAALAPFQNHVITGITALFLLFVFLNWLIVALSIPYLVKMLFGIESIFSRNISAMLNTTFFTAILGLTYLSVDPILKTVYVLRCFYGESLHSGEDLKADLKEFDSAPLRRMAALALVVSFACAAASAQTNSTPSPQKESTPAVSEAELDRQINTVIHEDKYAWRMDRASVVTGEAEKGAVSRFFDDVGLMIKRAIRATGAWMDRFFRRLPRGDNELAYNSGYDWISSSLLLYVLLAAVLGFLAVFFLRTRRRRSQPAFSIRAEMAPVMPDIGDEHVGADQLPEDGWIALAHRLLEQGEFRLAMRAFYLANLAHLAGRNLILIAKFKSNRDYEGELQRRAHAFPEVLPVFQQIVYAFERIWYGRHDVDREVVHQLAAKVERMAGLV